MKAISLLIPGSKGLFSQRLRGMMVLLAFVFVSGCSYVPDYLNPVSWFSDDKVKTATVPADEQDYQKLSTVPPAPNRAAVIEGLAADPNVQYEGEVSTGNVAVPVVTPPPPVPHKEPVAAPRTPVQGADLAAAAPPPASLPALEELGVAQTVETVEVTEAVEEVGARINSLENFDASRSFVSVQIGSIYYGNGSVALSSADRRQLKKIAKLSIEKDASLRVVGHSSSHTGNMAPLKHQIVNFDVSVRRANNVANALIKYGISPSSLYVGAVSDAEPVFFEVMPAGAAGNRRTEIYLDY